MKIKLDNGQDCYMVEHNEYEAIRDCVAASFHICDEGSRSIRITYMEEIADCSQKRIIREPVIQSKCRKVSTSWVYHIICQYIHTPFGKIPDKKLTLRTQTTRLFYMIQKDYVLLREKQGQSEVTADYKYPEAYGMQTENRITENNYCITHEQELRKMKEICLAADICCRGIPEWAVIWSYNLVFVNGKKNRDVSLKEQVQELKESGKSPREVRDYFCSFAWKFKQAREEAGLSQQELEKITGIPKRTLGNWEARINTPERRIQETVLKQLEEIYQYAR